MDKEKREGRLSSGSSSKGNQRREEIGKKKKERRDSGGGEEHRAHSSHSQQKCVYCVCLRTVSGDSANVHRVIYKTKAESHKERLTEQTLRRIHMPGEVRYWGERHSH